MRASLEPSVLVIGADEVFLPALKQRLAQHRVHVETGTLEQAVEIAVVAAPDMILLVGEAARDSGQALLTELTASPVSSVIPVALLGEDGALDARLRAFRYGAAAVIPRSASIDAIATDIARLAREIPERGGDALGEIGEATLSEFVSTLAKELRSGILSIQNQDDQAPVRLVLGSGRPLLSFIDEFVSKVRQHVVHAEPLRYEFDDRPGGTVQLLSGEPRDFEPPPSRINGLRLLLADDDSTRADVVAQALRGRGANVAVTALAPTDSELSRLRQLDPEVVIIGEAELTGEGFRLLRRLKRDTRLRWASLLVVRWDEMRDATLSVPAADRLTGPLAALGEVDRGLFDRAELGDAFDARLEVNGPARCLRALAASGRSLRVSIHNPRLSVEIDVSDGLVVGASATAPDARRWEGAAALSAFLVLSSGRVRVEPALQPATTNLMAPVDSALSLADDETPPIAPSLPAGGEPSVPPQAPPVPAAPALPAELALGSGAQRPSTRPKGAQRRVSKSSAAILVGLGVVAGFGIAVVLRGLTRDEEQTTQQTQTSTLAAPAAETAQSSPSVNSPAPLPVPSAAAPVESASSAVKTPPVLDETGQRAPSCEELIAEVEKPAPSDYPGAASDQLKLARKALVQGKLDEAHRAYCLAIAPGTKNPVHYFELSHLLLIRRDGAAATEWAQQGVRLDPTSARGQSLLGDGLARIGDLEGARRAWFASAGVHTPSQAEVDQLTQRSITEAEAAMVRRDHVRAERFFRRAAVLSPNNLEGPRGVSMAQVKLGDTANAVIWARKAVECSKTDPRARLSLGDALLATGDKEGAREAWLEAERLGYADARRRISRLDAAR